jgi:hypothetical protein
MEFFDLNHRIQKLNLVHHDWRNQLTFIVLCRLFDKVFLSLLFFISYLYLRIFTWIIILIRYLAMRI